MSLVNTRERSFYFDSKRDLVSQLRMALAEELSAVNSYEDLARGARMMGRPAYDGNGSPVEIPDHQLSQDDADKVSKFLEEIMKDELQHVGKLLALCDELDKMTREEIIKGRAGA